MNAPVSITEPGVYEISHADYHADPVPGGSLSSTGARRLLPPSCPAKFDYERRNPPEPTHALDLGNAAHDELLGRGPEIDVLGRISTRLARRIEAVYEQLSTVPGPSRTAAGKARQHGFAPPLAWDDECIDDPRARPCGLRGAA